MKLKHPIIFLTLLLASCAPAPATVLSASSTLAVEPASPTDSIPSTFTPLPPPAIVTPPNGSWQIQYTGGINTDLDVDIYNLDLFDTNPAAIADLHARGIFVMCYFSAGSFEDWRADAALFPQEILGNDMEGWPGEIWLDIRQINLLEPIIQFRL
ncbi:MAG: endo alpha-1,4 polygalactosaminidase, partial [Anaerolineales bacterium]|nr:endo alpha-1,4 polygalactosaminidase [Anaerolineales bacterium]